MKQTIRRENTDIIAYLQTFDIMWISEIKLRTPITVPGFKTYLNVDQQMPTRGGILLLIKSHLEPFISRVDVQDNGQIWINMSCLPNMDLGGAYIPPYDSPYYDARVFGALQARIIDAHEKGRGVILSGDINAREWDETQLQGLINPINGSYYNLPDIKI